MTTFDWQPIFEVAFDVNPGDEPGPSDWTDLSGRLAKRSRITTVRGMGRGGQFSGEASLGLANRDRHLDPTNSSAPYNLVPMRHARTRAIYDGNTYDLFRGFVDGWPPAWPNAAQSTINVRLVDGLAWLAMQDADLDLPRQRTHERINALLELAGWPQALRDIGTGRVMLTAMEQNGANLRRAVEDCADAEDGHLWVAADGTITFRSRHSRLNATVAATFGPSGLKVQQVDPAYDTQALTNLARVELANGDVFQAIDPISQATYGPRTLPVRDLDFPDYQAESAANWVVYRYSEPALWLDRVTVESRAGMPTTLTLDVGDRVDFEHTPPGGGTVEVTGHVERIRHEVSGGGTWLSRFDISPYFGEGPWLTLGDATLGRIGPAAGNMIGP